jgi:hypothetical protein
VLGPERTLDGVEVRERRRRRVETAGCHFWRRSTAALRSHLYRPAVDLLDKRAPAWPATAPCLTVVRAAATWVLVPPFAQRSCFLLLTTPSSIVTHHDG